MIGSGVPLAVASKVLRHSQVSVTADLYAHLSREVSHAAVDGLAAAGSRRSRWKPSRSRQVNTVRHAAT